MWMGHSFLDVAEELPSLGIVRVQEQILEEWSKEKFLFLSEPPASVD